MTGVNIEEMCTTAGHLAVIVSIKISQTKLKRHLFNILDKNKYKAIQARKHETSMKDSRNKDQGKTL